MKQVEQNRRRDEKPHDLPRRFCQRKSHFLNDVHVMGPRRGRFLLPPACLINLTCGQQGHCWVVIPIIRRITVLHLTAGGRVAVGHVLLGAPHEESLHAGVESGEGGAQEDRSAEIKRLVGNIFRS